MTVEHAIIEHLVLILEFVVLVDQNPFQLIEVDILALDALILVEVV